MSSSRSASGTLSPTLSTSLQTSLSAMIPDATALSPSTDLLIGHIAKSLSHNIATQLEQASNITHQYTDDQTYMLGHTSLDVYDKTLLQMRNCAGALPPRRTIVVDIAAFVEPENPYTNSLTRNNASLVPTRLLQLPGDYPPVTRVASSRFTTILTPTLHSALDLEMHALALAHAHTRAAQLLTRQKTVHRTANGKTASDPICLFEMVEQNYGLPFDTSKQDGGAFGRGKEVKHKVCEFAIGCDVCRDVHTFKVIR